MKVSAILLAAGKGTRFGVCETNKTAVKITGKSLIQRGIENIESFTEQIVVVVGYKKESVISSIKSNKVVFATQTRRLGTGHAVKVALHTISKFKKKPQHIFVANGDHLFMIEPTVISQFISTHLASRNDVTILSTENRTPDKLDNGRIIREGGNVVGIVEKSQFTKSNRSMPELNTGTYLFRYEALSKAFQSSTRDKGKELYITTVLFYAGKVGTFCAPYDQVGAGVNTKKDLELYLSTPSLRGSNSS